MSPRESATLPLLQEGGQLYTWGGAFEDSAAMSAALAPRLPAQKDNHQGCLGHGDKAGKLTPTRSAARRMLMCRAWQFLMMLSHPVVLLVQLRACLLRGWCFDYDPSAA